MLAQCLDELTVFKKIISIIIIIIIIVKLKKELQAGLSVFQNTKSRVYLNSSPEAIS